MTDELGIARREFGLNEFEITLLRFFGELFAAYGLLEHVHQMDRISTDLRRVMIVGSRKNLEREARGDAVHALVHARGIPVFLDTAGLGIGLLEAFAVIDTHFREKRRVLVLAQAGGHCEASERL